MHEQIGPVLSLLAAVCWGFNAIFISKGLKGSNSFAGAFFSMLIASLIYLIANLLTGAINETIPYENFLTLSFAGFVSFSLAYLFYFYSIGSIGVSRATSITSSRPLIAAVLAVLLLGEVMTVPIGAGTVFMVAGVVLVTMRDQVTSKVKPRIGKFFAILTAFCWGLYPILVKAGLQGLQSVFKASLIMMVMATALYVLLIICVGRLRLLFSINKRSLRFFALSGLANSSANLLYFAALMITQVTIVTPLSNLYPFFALILGVIMLNEKATLKIVFGTVLIFVGVLFITI